MSLPRLAWRLIKGEVDSFHGSRCRSEIFRQSRPVDFLPRQIICYHIYSTTIRFQNCPSSNKVPNGYSNRIYLFVVSVVLWLIERIQGLSLHLLKYVNKHWQDMASNLDTVTQRLTTVKLEDKPAIIFVNNATAIAELVDSLDRPPTV